ncbi:MAG: ABC transporter permease [Clostridia bacterium]|nr:ABC transporter permease [Clostridia bacterium]
MEEEDRKENNRNKPNEEQYSLNDDRRVKVLSPGALVAKRFFRNRLAVTGMSVLVFMFIFSFLGGVVTPYGEKQIFYRNDITNKEYCSVVTNEEFRYMSNDPLFSGIAQAQAYLAISSDQEQYSYNDVTYDIEKLSDDLYVVSVGGKQVGLAYKDIVNSLSAEVSENDFGFVLAALSAYAKGESSFTANGKTYSLSDGDIKLNGEDVAYISRFIVRSAYPDVVLSKRFKTELQEALETGDEDFLFTEDDGEEYEYSLSYDAYRKSYSVKQGKETRVIDQYSPPGKDHWLGTDGNGMDMLTRLMYGGRVSLIIGFIVVFIESIIGVIFGGISGYFGGWIDNLIMRVVDIFYCIPSTPLLIILGAMMDAYNVDPKIRMLYLMLILGFLGWPGVARLVRGQILSLREQEFMTATEAGGIRISRRIFRHLIPNVIPQLIVTMTMGLGSTIIIEATLSFLGLGVRFPFASWGNIINDVNNTFVLTNYLFIWIPAGVCLLATVLAFNLVGDGLRDAFDPKMKR